MVVSILPSIIMEYADDGDLYEKIVDRKKKKQLFDENEIWNVLIQTVVGLKNLHGLSILHRDLKVLLLPTQSANIFLTKSGEAKLGDMNVSKIAKNGLLYTQTGTPYYASPEVWKDEPYDAKSDIWSLGCVIYEMTTLEPPFQAEDMEGLFKSVTLGVYPPINPKFSKELGHVIKLMLQQKPKSRPSADKIFTSALVQKKIQEFEITNLKTDEMGKAELLKTIRIPKKLHYLTDRLPKPNYGSLTEEEGTSSLKDSPSLARNKKVKPNKSTLPKLNQVLANHSPTYDRLKGDRSKKKKVIGGGLVIEGRSKIIEAAKEKNRNLEKQIRQELKKIYRVRAVRSQDPKTKKSDLSLLLPPIRL